MIFVEIKWYLPLFLAKGLDEECLYAKTRERRRMVGAGDTGIYAVASELEGRKRKQVELSRFCPVRA